MVVQSTAHCGELSRRASTPHLLNAALVGTQEAKHTPRVFVEKVEIGWIGAETCRLALEGCTGSLETIQFLAQRDTSLQEPGSRLDAVPILQRLMDKEAQEPRAEKQHHRLPGVERSTIMGKLTTEHVNHSS